MPETAAPAPAVGWDEIGTRLSTEVDTLRASIRQLIAAGVESAQVGDQVHEACMTASRIAELLLDLDGYATTRKPATNHPA